MANHYYKKEFIKVSYKKATKTPKNKKINKTSKKTQTKQNQTKKKTPKREKKRVKPFFPLNPHTKLSKVLFPAVDYLNTHLRLMVFVKASGYLRSRSYKGKYGR